MTPTRLAAHVSLFQGSTNTTPIETVPLADMLQRIQDGTYRAYVEYCTRSDCENRTHAAACAF